MKYTFMGGKPGAKAVLKYGTNKVPKSDIKNYRKEYYRRRLKANPNHRQEMSVYQRELRMRIRNKVFEAYGNKCECCGETEPDFFSIDHVHGGGLAHRRKLGNYLNVYRAIIEEGFPDKYRLLCFNCNQARSRTHDKKCPHERAREKLQAKMA